MLSKFSTLFASVLVAILALSRSGNGKLQCPDKYCVMCRLPPNMTEEQVYGQRCVTSKDCAATTGHLCCRRDNYGAFCTQGVEDTPHEGRCSRTVPLPLGDRAIRCPADMSNMCSFDAECPLDEKCCRTACGHKECSTAVGLPKPTAVGSSVAATATAGNAAHGHSSGAASRPPTALPSPNPESSAATAVSQKIAGQKPMSEAQRRIMEMLRTKVALLSQRIQMWKEKALRLRQLLGSKMAAAAMPAEAAADRPPQP